MRGKKVLDNRKHFYEETEMTHEEIGKAVGKSGSAISMWVLRNYSKDYRKKREKIVLSNAKSGEKHPMYGIFGEENPKYKNGLSNGYKKVPRPKWFKGSGGKTYAYEHHVNYCKVWGLAEIPKGYSVHHIDRNRANNNIGNLQILTHSEHAKLHAKERWGHAKQESKAIAKDS